MTFLRVLNTILGELINQRKIIRLGPYSVTQLYGRTFSGKTLSFSVYRTIQKSVFIPIVTNPHVLEIIKDHPEIIKAIKKNPIRDGLKSSMAYLKQYYGKKNVELTFVSDRVSTNSWWSRSSPREIDYAYSVGTNLLRIYIALGELPKKIKIRFQDIYTKWHSLA